MMAGTNNRFVHGAAHLQPAISAEVIDAILDMLIVKPWCKRS